MKYIFIKVCSNPTFWYANKIGEYLPMEEHFALSGTGYLTKEGFIENNDGIVITIQRFESLVWALSKEAGKRGDYVFIRGSVSKLNFYPMGIYPKVVATNVRELIDDGVAELKGAQLQEECKHFNFHVAAKVGRLTDQDNSEIVKHYMLDLKVKCVDCGLPFEFKGLPQGMSFFNPMTSPDNIEARMPIQPSTDPVDHVNVLLTKK